jgi:DNA-binding NtrC family response regulator
MSPEHTASTLASRAHSIARRPGQLRVRIGDRPNSTVPVESGAPITFGRSRAAQVVIADQSVSKVHFSLRAVDGGVELEDLGSKNGTWFGERRVRRMTLLPRDRFWAGEVCIQLIDVDHVDVEVAQESEWGLLHGQSVAMRELFARLTQHAHTGVDLLIHGETGTGKDQAARSIHVRSPRSGGPFVVLECGVLPAALADAMLFGFRREVFEDAQSDQAGVFERADGGTLLIEDIDLLSHELQPKLLHVLEARQVSRLGEPERVRQLDLRVIATTRRDLSAEVRAQRFREDLCHRIASTSVRMPPLRERDADLFFLADRVLAGLREPHESPITLGDDAKVLMGAYDWPGNVRELDRTIRRSASLCRDRVIRSEDLEFGPAGSWPDKVAVALGGAEDYEALHESLDKLYLPRVLDECGTISASARRLGITRDRLRAKLRALGLGGED